MGRTNVVVSADLRDWLIAQQVWRAGVYVLHDGTYGNGMHYLDVISDKLEPGFHGVREIVVENGDLRFRRPGAGPSRHVRLESDEPSGEPGGDSPQRRLS